MIVEWILLKLFGVLFFMIIGLYLYFKLIVFNFWRRKGVLYEKPTFPTGNIATAIFNKKSIRKLIYFYSSFKK